MSENGEITTADTNSFMKEKKKLPFEIVAPAQQLISNAQIQKTLQDFEST